jgi:CheY-like chemotaxis protein
VLTVSDTGAGMSRAVMDRIFEPFFTTKEPDKGTGLGLSTVMGIVRGHGGVIHVESSPGKGSAFSVSIPAAPDEEYAAGAGLRPAMLRGRGETILVVDDEAIVRHVIGTALEEMNFNIVTAGDGREALSVITRLSAAPAVIFVDSQMPAMDGLVFLQNLRQALPDAKAIVMSGHLDERSRATFRNLGAAAILEKPFSLTTLATVLRQVLAYGRGSDAENTVS